MLLAEALVLRSSQQTRLKELSVRIEENARVPERRTPDEDPQMLLTEAVAVAEQLADLVQRINRTNSATAGEEASGASVSDLIARRDHAQRMTQLYRAVAKAGTRGTGRGWLARDTDQPTAAAVDVPGLQKRADEWAVRYRDLDVRLQQLNWATELKD